MNIQFKINYVTQWGQSVFLMLHNSVQSLSEATQSVVMQCNESFEWTTEIPVDSNTESIAYQYAILDSNKKFDFEYGKIRTLDLNLAQKKVIVRDFWRGPFGDSPFVTAAFSECFFKRKKSEVISQPKEANLTLRLNCPQMEPNRHIAVIGNQPALGNWDENLKVRLDDSGFPVWSIDLNAANFTFPLEYKYLIVDTLTDKVLA